MKIILARISVLSIAILFPFSSCTTIVLINPEATVNALNKKNVLESKEVFLLKEIENEGIFGSNPCKDSITLQGLKKMSGWVVKSSNKLIVDCVTQ